MSNLKNGGKREGAGRKFKFDEPTKVMRIPESRVLEIKAYLQNSPRPQPMNPRQPAQLFKIEARTHTQIPVALARIAAGFPSPAQDYIDKTIDLNEDLVHNKEATFIVEVESLSMLYAGIDIGDWLIVDRSLDAKHGDIVVAYIDNEFTTKRIMFEKNAAVWLKAENPAHRDIHFSEGQSFELWGIVIKVIKNLR